MSFKVNWDSLETDSLRSWTRELLTDALNSGKRPNILASDITIKDLNFGKIAPTFEILEIGELGRDRFRGIFKINYEGDFHLTLHTKVQANPLKIYSDNSLEKEVGSENSSFITPEFVLSNDAFNIPLDLKLSDIKISGIGIIVFSKTKGLTLVFRNDPLDSIKVSSTFDTVQVLANYLQKQIETQIRDLFRETLPTLIHKLSLKYTLVNDNTFNELRKKHSQQSEGSLGEDDTEDENDLFEFQSSISAKNLNKISKLFNSRETLKLSIPKFKKIIQRTHLEKFNKNLLVPNLVNSLYDNLNLSERELLTLNGGISNSNGIPIDLLLGQDYRKVNEILEEISVIQSDNYKSSCKDNKKDSISVKPKRRTIKLGSKLKKTKKPESVDLTSDASTLIDVPSTPVNQTFTLSNEVSPSMTASSSMESPIMKHPIPVKASPATKNAQRFSTNSPTPSASSNSMLTGLGLGHDYFNIVNSSSSSYPISTSPIKAPLPRTSIITVQMPPIQSAEQKRREALQHIDVGLINEKLKHLNFNSEKLSWQFSNSEFEAPPPYQYL